MTVEVYIGEAMSDLIGTGFDAFEQLVNLYHPPPIHVRKARLFCCAFDLRANRAYESVLRPNEVLS